jgi:RNA polymerase sigma factor (sigma-70 family)
LLNLQNCSDNELIRLTVDGNSHAYEQIVIRYQKLVYNVIYQIVKQKESAADMTQETFIKGYQSLARFKTTCAFRPWILRIATNSALNHIMDNHNNQSLDELIEEQPASEPAGNYNLEAEVDSHLITERLGAVLATLPPQHRNLFLLRYQHDLSYEEIAETLDHPVTTIKSLLFRARSKVRILMKDDYAELSSRG